MLRLEQYYGLQTSAIIVGARRVESPLQGTLSGCPNGSTSHSGAHVEASEKDNRPRGRSAAGLLWGEEALWNVDLEHGRSRSASERQGIAAGARNDRRPAARYRALPRGGGNPPGRGRRG